MELNENIEIEISDGETQSIATAQESNSAEIDTTTSSTNGKTTLYLQQNMGERSKICSISQRM